MRLVTTTNHIHHLPERHEAARAETLLYMDVPCHAIEQEVVHYRDVCYSATHAASEERSVMSTITQFIVLIGDSGVMSMTPKVWKHRYVRWLTSSNGYQDLGKLVRK